MAQTGYTPIQLYYSTTTTNQPSAGNLLDGELAINTADGKLFYKDNLGAVQVLATAGSVSSQWTTTGSNIYYNTGNVGIGTTSPAARLDIGSGNLNFSSTAQRITGDFTNTTIANRVMFQTTTSNSATSINAIPSGTQTASNIRAVNASDPTNAAFTSLSITSSACSLTAGIYGTGTYLPLTFSVNNAERMRIDTSGNVGIGTTSPTVKLDVIGSIEASVAATQDGVILAGRAGGTSSFAVTLTPTTLTASRTITLPDSTTTMVGTDTTQTLTNKRVNPRSLAAASTSGTVTPDSDLYDQVNYLLTGTATFAVPSGTPSNGQKLSIRLYAASTQTVAWTTTAGGYRIIGTTLPLSVAAGKTIYVGCVYNSTDAFWDVVAVATEA